MPRVETIEVPDIGDFDSVDVVEVLVHPGDRVHVEDPLITLESDKATMDVPSPLEGIVQDVKVRTGDKVSKGTVILTLEAADTGAKEGKEPPGAGEKSRGKEAPPPQAEPESVEARADEAAPEKVAEREPLPRAPEGREPSSRREGGAERTAPAEEGGEEAEERGAAFTRAYASPSVRRYARELGVDLARVRGSGRRGRILREDVQAYVKRTLAKPREGGAGLALPEMPVIDFSRFGEVERRPLTRIQRIAGPHLHRAWLHVPHVTQHDEADITELEAFRKRHADEAKARGFSLTLLPFVMRAAVAALTEHPTVNSSLDPDGENLLIKRYYHLGVAVDTPEGLVVPVVRDVDRKGTFQLAEELKVVSIRTRERKLRPDDLQGASFTISSLGGIGGSFFTPLVNAPEVAILGVSRAQTRPRWNGEEFVPRLVLPLSLSYDHRVIDGATAVRFTTTLGRLLGDLRQLLL